MIKLALAIAVFSLFFNGLFILLNKYNITSAFSETLESEHLSDKIVFVLMGFISSWIVESIYFQMYEQPLLVELLVS
jgi:uncharacterized membrane protein (DUF485 family)